MIQCNFCGLTYADTSELERHVVLHIKSQQFDGEHSGDIYMQSDCVPVKREVVNVGYPEDGYSYNIEEGAGGGDSSVKVESGSETNEQPSAADLENGGSSSRCHDWIG